MIYYNYPKCNQFNYNEKDSLSVFCETRKGVVS